MLAWCAVASTALGQDLHLIQGYDDERLKEALRSEGIAIQEEFSIINAVAATLTNDQRQALDHSSAVARVIDQIDTIDSPSDDADRVNTCAYAGSIFTSVQGSRLTWPILQTGESYDTLQEIELRWPAHWGPKVDITIDAKPLPKINPTSNGEQLSVRLTTSHVLNKKQHELELNFSYPAPHQSNIHATLKFSNDCATSLAKAYEFDNNDTHFNGLIGATDLHQLGILGQGVSIAILDSGLWNHPDLEFDSKGKARVLARYDATSGKEIDDLFDDSGHGTHMTSIAVNSASIQIGNEERYQGVAPDASVIAIKAFDVNGQATLLHLLRAMQWIADNRERFSIRILNLSFASHPRWPYWLDPVNQAIIRLWQRGVIAVASVGNSGPDPMSVGAPANIPYIISVGAITDSWTPTDLSDDFVPLFSSQGPSPLGHVKPDIVAPGGHIEGLTRPGSTLTKDHPDFMKRPDRIAMTGTSQAAAVASGAIALLLQLEPDLTPDQVKCRLMSSANPAILPDGKLAYSPLKQGSGLINISRALTTGDNDCDNGQDQLTQEISGDVFFTGPVELDAQGHPIIPENLRELLGDDPAQDAPTPGIAWGVKAHVERLSERETHKPSDLQAQWISRYLAELERLKDSQQAH